jgi:hypothetical protein
MVLAALIIGKVGEGDIRRAILPLSRRSKIFKLTAMREMRK